MQKAHKFTSETQIT